MDRPAGVAGDAVRRVHAVGEHVRADPSGDAGWEQRLRGVRHRGAVEERARDPHEASDGGNGAHSEHELLRVAGDSKRRRRGVQTGDVGWGQPRSGGRGIPVWREPARGGGGGAGALTVCDSVDAAAAGGGEPVRESVRADAVLSYYFFSLAFAVAFVTLLAEYLYVYHTVESIFVYKIQGHVRSGPSTGYAPRTQSTL